MNFLISSFRQLNRTLVKNQFGSLNGVHKQMFFTSPVCCRINSTEDERLMCKRYMDSPGYYKCYANDPVWKYYRRNFKGQKPPAPRKTCIRAGRIATGNPCPMCRDHFLHFDYRNVKLLRQFVDPATGKPYPNSKTNICGEQQRNLVDEVLRSQQRGYMLSYVPVKKYDYEQFYKIAEKVKSTRKDYKSSTADKSTKDTSTASQEEDVASKT